MFKFQDDARPCYHCPYRRSDFDIVDLQKIYGGKIFSHKNGFSEREADGVRFSRGAREPSYTPFSPSVDC